MICRWISKTINILTNKEVIAVDQDVMGIQAFQYKVKDSAGNLAETV